MKFFLTAQKFYNSKIPAVKFEQMFDTYAEMKYTLDELQADGFKTQWEYYGL